MWCHGLERVVLSRLKRAVLFESSDDLIRSSSSSIHHFSNSENQLSRRPIFQPPTFQSPLIIEEIPLHCSACDFGRAGINTMIITQSLSVKFDFLILSYAYQSSSPSSLLVVSTIYSFL